MIEVRGKLKTAIRHAGKPDKASMACRSIDEIIGQIQPVYKSKAVD